MNKKVLQDSLLLVNAKIAEISDKIAKNQDTVSLYEELGYIDGNTIICEEADEDPDFRQELEDLIRDSKDLPKAHTKLMSEKAYIQSQLEVL